MSCDTNLHSIRNVYQPHWQPGLLPAGRVSRLTKFASCGSLGASFRPADLLFFLRLCLHRLHICIPYNFMNLFFRVLFLFYFFAFCIAWIYSYFLLSLLALLPYILSFSLLFSLLSRFLCFCFSFCVNLHVFLFFCLYFCFSFLSPISYCLSSPLYVLILFAAEWNNCEWWSAKIRNKADVLFLRNYPNICLETLGENQEKTRYPGCSSFSDYMFGTIWNRDLKQYLKTGICDVWALPGWRRRSSHVKSLEFRQCNTSSYPFIEREVPVHSMLRTICRRSNYFSVSYCPPLVVFWNEKDNLWTRFYLCYTGMSLTTLWRS